MKKVYVVMEDNNNNNIVCMGSWDKCRKFIKEGLNYETHTMTSFDEVFQAKKGK